MTLEERDLINRRYEIAVRNLNSAAWGKMQDSEKLQDLQAIENKNALEQHRLACEVVGENMEKGDWGYQQGLKIAVNSNELNNPNFMEHVDTVFHEGSHTRDWQAQFLTELKSEYTPEDLKIRNSPIPDYEKDPNGYFYHPAEVAARQAGEEGVRQIQSDREHILNVDAEMQEQQPFVNQILQTYDYVAMNLDTEIQDENLEGNEEKGEMLEPGEIEESFAEGESIEGGLSCDTGMIDEMSMED